ncbi:MAG TPA: hypothetical protein VFX48_04835 [Saprospiraceae bacterium]|nr:hypothetical protein [Saprospiraceae bacterium]
MSASEAPKSFIQFLSYFPKTTLPLTLQHSDYHDYSTANDPLPDVLLQQYVFPHLDFEIDEFVEFLPILQFDASNGMHQLVLWTARLLHYSFYLLNFNPQGTFIHASEIAGFYSDRDLIRQKMAHIDAEGNVFILEGSLAGNQKEIDPHTTKKWHLEYLPDGTFRLVEIQV